MHLIKFWVINGFHYDLIINEMRTKCSNFWWFAGVLHDKVRKKYFFDDYRAIGYVDMQCLNVWFESQCEPIEWSLVIPIHVTVSTEFSSFIIQMLSYSFYGWIFIARPTQST